MKPKIGLVTVSLAREMPELARDFHKRAISVLTKNAEVIAVKDGQIALTREETVRQARIVEEKGAECVLFAVGSWILAPQVVCAAQAVHKPIGLWTSPCMPSAAMVGGSITHGSLDEVGINHAYFYGWPEEKETYRDILSWARAAAVVSRLKGQTYGLFGGMCMGMYTAMVDFAQIQSLFGIEIKHRDQMVLMEKAKSVDEKEVRECFKYLKDEFGQVLAPEEVVLRSIRLYLGTKRVIEKEALDFVGIKCQPEVIERYVSFCLAIALLNDEGIVASCEADTNGALTMQILHLLSDQVVLFADLYHVDKKEKVLRLLNCGTAATKLARNRKEVDLGYQFEYMGEGRGVTTIFCCKPGKVTLARLVRIKGAYHLFISGGEAFEQPKEKFKEAKEVWPHAFIKMDDEPVSFIQEARSNHIHMIYGDYKKELFALCKILGIRTITCS